MRLPRRAVGAWWIGAFLVSAGLADGVNAQAGGESFDPPVKQTDSRGVDLVAGAARISIPLVAFGETGTGLSASFQIVLSTGGSSPVPGIDFYGLAGGLLNGSTQPAMYTGGGYNDELGTFTSVHYPNESGFYLAHSMHQIVNSDGSRYQRSIGPNFMTAGWGHDPNLGGFYNSAGDRGIFDPGSERIIRADGEEWRLFRQLLTVQGPFYPQQISRLRFAISSRGYGIQFLYVSNVVPTTLAGAGTWLAPSRVTAYNKASVFCNESLLAECAAVSALPSTEIAYNATAGTVLVKEPGSADGIELTFPKVGNIWHALSSMRHTGIPGSTRSYLYGTTNAGDGFVQRVTDADGQWNYTRLIYLDDSGYVPEMAATSTNPLGGVVQVTGHTMFGQMTMLQDELGRPTWPSVSTRGGDYRVYGWSNLSFGDMSLDLDIRNNIRSAVHYPLSASGLPPRPIYTATYPTDCINPRTCNRPLTTADGNGNVTDYTYAPQHGGVLTETRPAPAPGGVRPQTRHQYSQRHAWISNGSGGYMHASSPVWLRTSTSICRTSAANTTGPHAPCSVAGDEILTQYDYGPDSGPNTLLLRGQSVTSTDVVNGSPVTTTLRTCYGYDALGRRISETQPNATLGSCP